MPADESEFFNKYFPGFSSDFQVLTRGDGRNGYAPLGWQWRLFKQFCQNDIRKVCDLPTGLGKTSVIHIWLLALRRQILENMPRLPTRLVYVVDRRTVVDQATQIAEGAKKNLTSLGLADDWLSVSTLRGQFADNREWTTDPSRPAIIIGTVDMIGSRLLFSGYRSSYKRRPLDAGLLGQDALLVLDEAHLSEPFAKLVRALSDEGTFQQGQGKPMRVMCMSATTAGDDPHRFKLEETDLEGTPDTNPIIQRYEAKKRLSISTPLDKKAVETGIIEAATRLAGDGARVVIFVRRPEDAQRIERDIGKLKPFLNAVTVLTGTMRGLERDELLERPVMKRFLDGDERPEDRPGKAPAILVSTSAGEVGFDLNADHMVSDAAPLDSMIQRLGRVNRRGYGDATVEVFVAKSEEKDQKRRDRPKEKTKHTYESAAAEAIKCLGNLEKNSGGGTFNASPKALDALKKTLTEQQLLAASAPKPTTVELTDILLDAWSMTTITQPMPGRPPVPPWLRGLDAEGPQTTIAWRAELDIEGFDQLEADDMEEWFDTHRVLPHETLSVPTSKAEKWITGRWKALPNEVRDAVGERSCVIDRAGLQVLKLVDLVEELTPKPDSIANADVILPAAFGGIERGKGLLNEAAPELVHPESEITRVEALKSPDVADMFGRCRLLRISGDDAESETALIGAGPIDRAGRVRFVIDLPSNGDVCRQLISLVPRFERADFSTAKQPLSCHVSLVEKHARNIALELGLRDDTRQAVELAATWHDNGKDRPIWQRAAGRKDGEVPLGKSGGSMRPVAGGYRHEFGSLRKFIDAHEGKVPCDVFDLAMHLIATHHGRGRPHFPKGGYDPLARSNSPQVATEVVRRFARLQRKYGPWRLAWLENLLRCADAMASADKEGT